MILTTFGGISGITPNSILQYKCFKVTSSLDFHNHTFNENKLFDTNDVIFKIKYNIIHCYDTL